MSDLAGPPAVLLRSRWLPVIRIFVRRVVALMQWIPDETLTSWFRTPERNRIEGGDPESQHLFALAIDLDVPPGDLATDAATARSFRLVPDISGGILHVQLFPAGVLARAGITFPR